MAGKKTQAQLTPEEKLQQALVPEAEQPYKVPANWCWTYLKNVSDCLDNFRKPINANERNARLGDVPYYGATGQVGWIDDYLTNEELVLLGEDGAPFLDLLKNKAYLINGKAWVNNHAHILRSKFGTMGNRLLIEYLNSFDFTGFVTGTTRLKLTQASMNKIIIPLVPLAEQQRIVERIESLFAKLDETKEKLQNTLDTFEIRKTAILHKAFTGELTANWRKHHGLTMDSWEEKTLNDIASYKKGPFGSSITKAMFVPKTANTYKVYEQGNVIRKDLTYGHYYITSEKYQELKGFSVKAGDILISCAGTIGEVYKLPPECEEGVINQALMRVRLNQNIIEGYFCYYFGEIIKDDVIDKSNGTAMKNIPPFKVLKAIQIKLPTINEQTEIVRIVDNLLAKEQKAHSIAQNALAKIDLIKKSILVRAFRGQLATNNPADESAVELLKRVL